MFNEIFAHEMESTTVFDSGFYAADSGFQVISIFCQWNLDSGFQSIVDFGFFELYSGFQSPGFRIPQAKIPQFLEFGFPCMRRKVQ